MDENVTACVYEAGDWTTNVSTDMTIAVTGLTCTGADAILDINISADANETGANTNPVVSYTDAGTAGSITLTSGNMALHAAVTVTDAAKPIVLTATISRQSISGLLFNTLDFTYSENINLYRDGSGGTAITFPGSATSTTTLGAMTSTRTLAGIGSWLATNGGDMATNSATGNMVYYQTGNNNLRVALNNNPSAYFNTGSTAPTTSLFTPVSDANDVADAAGNPVNNAVSVNFTVFNGWDVVAPTVLNTYSCDTDLDGDIDQMQLNFSEDMYDSSFVVGNLEVDNDSINNGVGEEIPSNYDTSSPGCDGTISERRNNDHRGRLSLATGISGTQAAYFHNVTAGIRDHAGNLLANGAGLGTENDKAAPAPISAEMTDEDADGYVDLISIDFSEDLSALIGANLDWAISSASNFSGFVEGTVECHTGSAAADECRYNFTTTTSKTDVGDLTLTYTAGTTVSDGSNRVDTISFTSSSSTPIIDSAAPVVVDITPSDSSTTAGITDDIIITFSESMDTTFDEGTEFSMSADPGVFTETWSAGNTVVNLDPDTNLACDTTYTVTTAEGMIDASAGTPTGLLTTGPEDGDWSFTTQCNSGGGMNFDPPALTYSTTVTAPNGGEFFDNETSTTITWTNDGTGTQQNVNIYLSTDNGASYTEIIHNLQNSGSYNWNIPTINSENVLIMVAGTDLVTEFSSDISDATFTVGDVDTAEVTPTPITAPESNDMGLSPVTGLLEPISIVNPNDYITGASFDTVYLISPDGKRHPFMDRQTYFTWEDSFDNVKVVTDATLTTLTLGVPMLPKPGVVFVKIQSVPNVYIVEIGNTPLTPTLRLIPDETMATVLAGNDWADYVIDVSVTLFTRFEMGEIITNASDVSVDVSQMKKRDNLN